MRSLSERLKALESEFQRLAGELQQLKKRAVKLEKENARLQEELARAYKLEPEHEAACAGEKDTLSQEGLKRLVKLYDEGFHICNQHFGQFRDGECLFCVAFLRRKGE